MKYNQAKEDLIRAVQEEFNRKYPFLKIEVIKEKGKTPTDGKSRDAGEGEMHTEAKDLLEQDARLSDDTRVHDLEASLQQLLGVPFQVYRKSGNYWMETRMTGQWTLKQQNDHGQDISSFYW